MLRGADAFLAELGLQRSGPRRDQWGDDPGSEIWRAGLTHPVLHRMLAKAEQLAPMLGLRREVVFGLLRDLVIEEAERAPFGLVAREQASPGSMSLQEFLAEAARVADARHGQPRAPEWAVPLDAEDRETGGPSGG